MEFVSQESKKANPNERLLGSSEVIESLFGKQKMLENEQSKNGFTGLILSAAAFVSQTSVDVVKQAMLAVRIQDVKDWTSKKIGETVQSTKKKIFNIAHQKNCIPILPTNNIVNITKASQEPLALSATEFNTILDDNGTCSKLVSNDQHADNFVPSKMPVVYQEEIFQLPLSPQNYPINLTQLQFRPRGFQEGHNFLPTLDTAFLENYTLSKKGSEMELITLMS